jgi:hypothetical protein
MSEVREWVASRGGACWPASNDQFLWVSADRRRSVLLGRAEAVLWQMALTFQSRDALLVAAQQRQSMPPSVAASAFARLQELDLLVTPMAMIGDASSLPPPPAPVVAVRTYQPVENPPRHASLSGTKLAIPARFSGTDGARCAEPM